MGFSVLSFTVTLYYKTSHKLAKVCSVGKYPSVKVKNSLKVKGAEGGTRFFYVYNWQRCISYHRAGPARCVSLVPASGVGQLGCK